MDNSAKEARLITISEFEQQYPKDRFEIYSISALHKFRGELIKAEGVDDKTEAFKQATKDLTPLAVQRKQSKEFDIVFVRRKVVGEK